MSVLTFMRGFLHAADQNTVRVAMPRSTPRVVNLNLMKVRKRHSEHERREKIERGLVAEMTERQAGL